ncbi:hypothetical protein UFOVP555_45 [uncultured Caudovirales phage]|uniref:Uncharacterized protein n=1 Tax=uncultured Caudovirales phage TaxID=2100421 RepID=A0A6J5MY25_9CAUD|nr:hypothetical protein UFOVP555_45 [uncultured Caudovirales phage]
MVQSNELHGWNHLPLWQHEHAVEAAGEVFPITASGCFNQVGVFARRHANGDVFALVKDEWVKVPPAEGEFVPQDSPAAKNGTS